MFLPENVASNQQKELDRLGAFKFIEQWCLEIMPAEIRADASVSIQELSCQDPNCSPIDTAVTILFKRYDGCLHCLMCDTEPVPSQMASLDFSGYNGVFSFPMTAKEVTKEKLEGSFPTREVLEKWQRGEDADWPPDEEETQMPALRFAVGTKVICRIGPNAETDWAPGTISLLWYRETNWPPGSYAPYRIKLDDGRDIFAPGDIDQIIQKR